MVVYREFCTKEKTMQELMKEIIFRALEDSWDCQIVKDNIEYKKKQQEKELKILFLKNITRKIMVLCLV